MAHPATPMKLTLLFIGIAVGFLAGIVYLTGIVFKDS